MRRLDLSHCDGVVDLSALGECGALEMVDLANCTRLGHLLLSCIWRVALMCRVLAQA